MNFIILHGTLGSPNDNWFPWLSKKLENTGHKVHRPKLPTPEGQNLPSWVGVIDSCVKTIHVPLEQIIFVAHSMSPYAVCHYLTTISSPVHSCYFVAPFAKRLPDTPEPYPALNNPFVDTPIDWDLVRDHAGKVYCFASDNDPYVPLQTTEHFAANLGADCILVPNAGHFNSDSGYREFPLLLQTLQTKI